MKMKWRERKNCNGRSVQSVASKQPTNIFFLNVKYRLRIIVGCVKINEPEM